MNEYILAIGTLLAGIIFFAVAGIYITSSAEKIPEYEIKGNAEKIVSILNQLSKQPSHTTYRLNISLSDVKIEDGFLTLKQMGKKCTLPVPKDVQNAELKEIASLCFVKQKSGGIIVKEKCS